MKPFRLAAVILSLFPLTANATPSTQIWIPSTDIQKYKSLHLNIDNYLPAKKESGGSWKSPVFMAGPTIGILPYEKIQAEAGFDLMKSGAPSDSYPLYLHAKTGALEGALFSGAPALVVGGYNFGQKAGLTNQNIVYGLTARSFPKVGRLSAGYYSGNKKVLVNENGTKSNTGLLLSWDRTITEVSDKLWAAVDYQSGNSSLGAFSFGVSWAFAPNTSMIFGYDVYNNVKVAGRDTFTVQMDINLW